MPRTRTAVEAAAGQLILAVQKEWHLELGTPSAEVSEAVMDRAHELLQATKTGGVQRALDGRSVADFLGSTWVAEHEGARPAIQALESSLADGQHA